MASIVRFNPLEHYNRSLPLVYLILFKVEEQAKPEESGLEKLPGCSSIDLLVSFRRSFEISWDFMQSLNIP
jgi:hypothetical protein